MPCTICDDKGWVCEIHPDRPWNAFSSRADACGCGPGVPCVCNTDPLTDARHGGRFEPVEQTSAEPQRRLH